MDTFAKNATHTNPGASSNIGVPDRAWVQHHRGCWGRDAAHTPAAAAACDDAGGAHGRLWCHGQPGDDSGRRGDRFEHRRHARPRHNDVGRHRPDRLRRLWHSLGRGRRGDGYKPRPTPRGADARAARAQAGQGGWHARRRGRRRLRLRARHVVPVLHGPREGRSTQEEGEP